MQLHSGSRPGGIHRDEIGILIVFVFDGRRLDACPQRGEGEQDITAQVRLAAVRQLPVAVGLRNTSLAVADKLGDRKISVHRFEIESLALAIQHFLKLRNNPLPAGLDLHHEFVILPLALVHRQRQRQFAARTVFDAGIPGIQRLHLGHDRQHDLARLVDEIHVHLDRWNAVHRGVLRPQDQIDQRRLHPAVAWQVDGLHRGVVEGDGNHFEGLIQRGVDVLGEIIPQVLGASPALTAHPRLGLARAVLQILAEAAALAQQLLRRFQTDKHAEGLGVADAGRSIHIDAQLDFIQQFAVVVE